MNSLVLSPQEFLKSVKQKYYDMNLEEIFKINKDKIHANFEQWEKQQFKKVYSKYLAMLMGLPDHMEFIDMELFLFKIARNIAHELIIVLAESYYYDDNMSIIGEQKGSVYYPEYTRNVSDLELAYFFTLFDSVYDRNEYGEDTLSLIRKTFRNDSYLSDIFAREKGK